MKNSLVLVIRLTKKLVQKDAPVHSNLKTKTINKVWYYLLNLR